MSATFSTLPLAATCAGSAVIPPVDDDNEESEARDRGTAIHAFLERVAQIRAARPEVDSDAARAIALGEVGESDYATALRGIDLDTLPAHLAGEVALAWDWRTRRGRELGRNLGRRYPALGPTEVAGTVDVLGLDTPTVYVGDYKTGRTRYARPGSYLQTVAGALAAASALGATRAVVELVYLDEDGRSWPVRDELDEWDLASAAESLSVVMDRVTALGTDYRAGVAIPLSTGPHCARCRALKNCPAQTALVRALPSDVVELVDRPDYLSPERVADTFRRVEEMKSLLARVESEVFALAAREGGIDLGDGRVLGPVEWERERLDGSAAHDLLATWYGTAVARDAAKLSVSKEAARAVIANRLQPKEKLSTKRGDGVFDRFLAALRASGGVRTESGTSIKVHAPKALKKGA